MALTFKRQELFPNTHPLYAGHLGFRYRRSQLERMFTQADLDARGRHAAGRGVDAGLHASRRRRVPAQPLIHVHRRCAPPRAQFRADDWPDRRSDGVPAGAGGEAVATVNGAQGMGGKTQRLCRRQTGLDGAEGRPARHGAGGGRNLRPPCRRRDHHRRRRQLLRLAAQAHPVQRSAIDAELGRRRHGQRDAGGSCGGPALSRPPDHHLDRRRRRADDRR